MSQTKHERQKIQKRQRREKEVLKKANIERSNPSTRFRLDIEVDGVWTTGVKYFRLPKDVEYHKKYTEAMRNSGNPILHGIIFDTMKSKIVANIPASKAKGAAPDKISEGIRAHQD